ncbi:uncharacterized protein LOC120681613 isoform X1 [Panicum virgatum]|uniref:uncharacterized protein LOC120681613 isoform X1 n=1 Tax=Panicum virgatum TaxID=38727 RepID=UPI0019D5E69D|nr:uncharacterized protein LOC120681613 isoform X1 [Panicum virgatum]
MGTASTGPDTMEATRAPGLSITIEKNPPEARLLQLGVKSWPKYSFFFHPLLSSSGLHVTMCDMFFRWVTRILPRFFREKKLCFFSCAYGRWGCPPGRFPLKFDAALTCYLVKGRVRAAVKGSRECVEFGAGDLVVFPKGLSCTWDVVVAVDKHYNFDPS